MKAFIDIDGVIADDRHRVHFALAKNWDAYFAAMGEDTVWPQGRNLVQWHIDMGIEFEYMTGRRDDTRTMTEDWLALNDFPDRTVHMRPPGLRIPLANLKEMWLRSVVEETGDRVVLYDDDPEVIDFVQTRLGKDAATLCTWNIKEKALVKEAQA